MWGGFFHRTQTHAERSRPSAWSLHEAKSGLGDLFRIFPSGKNGISSTSSLQDRVVPSNDEPVLSTTLPPVDQTHGRHDRPIPSRIIVEPTMFVAIWLIVCGLRFTTIWALLLFLWYFNVLVSNNPIVKEWRRDVHTLSNVAIHAVWYLLGSMFLMHLIKLVEMLKASFQEHQLVFHRTRRLEMRRKKIHPTKTKRWAPLGRMVRHIVVKIYSLGMRLYAVLNRLFDCLMNAFSFMGLRSKWFNEVFAVRESLELATQTFQCYRMQCLISNDLINGVAITTLLVGSVSTFAIEFVTKEFHEKTLQTRLALMVTDACLDLMFAIGLPLGLMVTLLLQLDLARNSFLDEQLCDDVWYPKTIREFQQFILSSTWDIVSQSIFQFGLVHCLWRAQALVHRQDQIDKEQVRHELLKSRHKRGFLLDNKLQLKRDGKHGAGAGNSTHVAIPEEAEVVDDTTDHVTRWLSSYIPLTPSSKFIRFQQFKNRMLEWIPVLHAMVGVVAVVASLCAWYAIAKPVEGCKLSGYAWFRDHPVCVVMEINCYRRQILGANDTIDEILGQMDTTFLFSLSFSHCPALQLPNRFREIKSLYMMDLFNCTLIHWPISAGLGKYSNPQLTGLRFVHTSFAHGLLPEGLTNVEFASTMTQIVFAHTYLHNFPPDIAKNWQPVSSLYVEHGLLTEIPPVLRELTAIQSLSFVNNSITQIPDGLLNQMRLERLFLAGNPLQTLPQELAGSVLSNA